MPSRSVRVPGRSTWSTIGARSPIADRTVAQFAGIPANWATVRAAIGDLAPIVDQVDLPGTRTERDGIVLPGPFKSIELHIGRRPTQLSLDRYAAIQ